MATKMKPPVKKAVPPPGRKMNKKEAREFVFKEYRGTMAMLAKQ